MNQFVTFCAEDNRYISGNYFIKIKVNKKEKRLKNSLNPKKNHFSLSLNH